MQREDEPREKGTKQNPVAPAKEEVPLKGCVMAFPKKGVTGNAI
jgi:hypothetical protein